MLGSARTLATPREVRVLEGLGSALWPLEAGSIPKLSPSTRAIGPAGKPGRFVPSWPEDAAAHGLDIEVSLPGRL